MKKLIRNLGVISLLALSGLPCIAQINGTGYYRVYNAQNTSDYITIANDKFNFTTAIGTACGGLSKAYTSAGQARAMECVGRYLQTDIHLVDDTDFTTAAAVIYCQKKNDNPNDKQYNLIGQGTSLLTLTAGIYPGSVQLKFYDNYITINPVSGNGADTQYTASIQLKAQNVSIANLGTRYFVDDNGTFGINTSYSAQNAKWYILPVTHFNVVPEVEFNGKYYTTVKVPFACKLSGQVEKAYVITAINNGVLEYQEIATTGGTIPIGTPVVLECGSPNAADCQLIPTGAPRFTAPNNSTTSDAPTADETSDYTGTNLLKGTYFCNTDGSLSFPTPSGTSSFNANNRTLSNNPKQLYTIGLTESGNLGFVKATVDVMPANKAWLEVAGEIPTVAAPTINPAAGTYSEAQTVTITAEEGAVIYYTTDGSEPTTASTQYTGPFTVSETTTVKAFAMKEGLYNNSDVISAEYVIAHPVLTIAPELLTINDSGVNNSLTITGTDINGNINASLADNNDWMLNPETFSNTGGNVSVTYTGRALSAQNTVNAYAANNPSVTASANVIYTPEIFIVTDNGAEGNWNFNDGTLMDNENGTYTATITTTVPNTFILFARKLGDGVNWNTRYVFGPSSDGDWWMPTDVANQGGYIDVNDDDPIKLQLAGEYTITINANEYTFNIIRKLETLAAPTFTPAAGTYTEAQSVAITAQEGATIYYTTDGTEPTTESAIYTEPINVGEGTTTIKAIAVMAGWNNSEVATAEYVIEIPVTVMLGDVNEDGILDINDVTCLIDHLLSLPIEVFNEANADVDQDNAISIEDVTLLIDVLLGTATL